MGNLLKPVQRRRMVTGSEQFHKQNSKLIKCFVTSISVDGKAKGMMCLVTGKRHLICQDISSAVESLGE